MLLKKPGSNLDVLIFVVSQQPEVIWASDPAAFFPPGVDHFQALVYVGEISSNGPHSIYSKMSLYYIYITCVYRHSYIYIYILMYVHMHMHTYAPSHIYICIYIYVYVYIMYISWYFIIFHDINIYIYHSYFIIVFRYMSLYFFRFHCISSYLIIFSHIPL